MHAYQLTEELKSAFEVIAERIIELAQRGERSPTNKEGPGA